MGEEERERKGRKRIWGKGERGHRKGVRGRGGAGGERWSEAGKVCGEEKGEGV